MAESRSFRQSQLSMISGSHVKGNPLPPNEDIKGNAASEELPGAESSASPGRMFVASKVALDDSIENTDQVNVVIPHDLTMATAIRAYNEWPGMIRSLPRRIMNMKYIDLTIAVADKSGTLVNTKGALLPPYYKLGLIAGFEWICPVRNCRRSMKTLSSLSGHFLVRAVV